MKNDRTALIIEQTIRTIPEKRRVEMDFVGKFIAFRLGYLSNMNPEIAKIRHITTGKKRFASIGIFNPAQYTNADVRMTMIGISHIVIASPALLDSPDFFETITRDSVTII